MTVRKLTFEFDTTDGKTIERSVDIDVGNTVEKQKYVGLISANSPIYTVDNIKFGFVTGSANGLLLGTTDGSVVIDGFHWCLYATTGVSNYLIDNLTLTTTMQAIPDNGITEAAEWRKVWFFVKGVDNTTIYHMEAYERNSKILIQIWKE